MKPYSLIRTALLLVVSGFAPVLGADVIDASLRLRFSFDSAPVNDVIVDSSPSATHPGVNHRAAWAANESGRAGVMDFMAPIPNRITVPAIPALNSKIGRASCRERV